MMLVAALMASQTCGRRVAGPSAGLCEDGLDGPHAVDRAVFESALQLAHQSRIDAGHAWRGRSPLT